ncbi:hypothetical protein AMK15_12045 [Streptomyces sp. MJM1172]|nr:hypothetical protein AMK15_12045 [Streptomyces sp. MJM1172]
MTAAMRAEAARSPDGWVYEIDQFVDAAGRVPPYAIIGAWRVDHGGNVTDEFKRNPGYRPSPRSLGMGEPTDAVDAAIQLAATGYGGSSGVHLELMRSSAFVIPGSVSRLMLSHSLDTGEERILEVFTDGRHAPDSEPELQVVNIRSLVDELPPDVILKINPYSAASVSILVGDVVAS